MKEDTNLSERFERLKVAFKLNNGDLARIAGVSNQAIGDIVNGVTDNPKVGLLVKISTGLKVNLNWLATGEGEMLETNSRKNEDGKGLTEKIYEMLINQLSEKDHQINVLLGKSGSVSLARMA